MPAGQREKIAERRKIGLELRQAGLTYRELAAALTKRGFPCKFTTAYKDVMRCLDEIANKTHEEADQLRTMEVTRLDTILKSIWSRVIKGDVSAIDRALKISERRSKLLGIDAPDRLDIESNNINIEVKVPDDVDLDKI